MDSGRGTTRAEEAQGTPTQSHISPSILVYEDKGLGFNPETQPLKNQRRALDINLMSRALWWS